MMKKLKNLIFLSSFILLTSVGFGQMNPQQTEEKPSIEITGTAENEVIPDEIFISITLKERQEKKENISIDVQDKALKNGLKEMGISLDMLSLSNANADYIRVKWRTKEVVSQTEYVLKVSNAEQVAKVFQKLDELKIMDAYILRTSHSKIDELKKEVRILAIKAAKEKADYLLSAIGEETGKAIKVHEQSNSYRIDNANLNVRGARSEGTVYYVDGVKVGSNPLDKDNLQFKKIKLQAAIYVKFEIK